MSAGSLDGMLQCSACHGYSPAEDPACAACGALLPKGRAERQRRARDLPKERAAELEAYERYKLEATHVPRWMRRAVLAFNRANDDIMIHRMVQGAAGLLGFWLAFTAAGPLLAQLPLTAPWAARLGLPMRLAVGVLAFVLTSSFLFAVFRNIMEAMVQVFGDEQDAFILRGQAEEKASRLKSGR